MILTATMFPYGILVLQNIDICFKCDPINCRRATGASKKLRSGVREDPFSSLDHLGFGAVRTGSSGSNYSRKINSMPSGMGSATLKSRRRPFAREI
jgi:hypothetical protein